MRGAPRAKQTMPRAWLLMLLLSSLALAAEPPEAQLEDARRAAHPGSSLPPRCAHPDPVRVLHADLDDAPGEETALASARLGVIVLSADGRPLAWRELGCGEAHSTAALHTEVRALAALPATGGAHAELAQHGPLRNARRVDAATRARSLARGAAARRRRGRPLLRRRADGALARAGGAGRARALAHHHRRNHRAWREGGSYGPPHDVHHVATWRWRDGRFQPAI